MAFGPAPRGTPGARCDCDDDGRPTLRDWLTALVAPLAVGVGVELTKGVVEIVKRRHEQKVSPPTDERKGVT